MKGFVPLIPFILWCLMSFSAFGAGFTFELLTDRRAMTSWDLKKAPDGSIISVLAGDRLYLWKWDLSTGDSTEEIIDEPPKTEQGWLSGAFVSPSIAIDSSGGIHIAYILTSLDPSTDELIYVRKLSSDSDWTIERRTIGKNANFTDIEIKSDGSAVILYGVVDYIAPEFYLELITFSGSWGDPVPVFSSTSGRIGASSLSLDASENPIVFYSHCDGSTIDLAYWSGGTGLRIDTPTRCPEKLPSFVDSSGAPQVYYRPTYSVLRRAIKSGAVWTTEDIITGGVNAFDAFLGSSGDPVVYYYKPSDRWIYAGSYDGTSWSFGRILEPENDPGLLKGTEDFMIYRLRTGSFYWTHFAKTQFPNWEVVKRVPYSLIEYMELFVDNAGGVHVVYNQAGEVSYLIKRGSSISETLIDKGLTNYNPISLFVDNTQIPSITYNKGDGFYLATKTVAGWITVRISTYKGGGLYIDGRGTVQTLVIRDNSGTDTDTVFYIKKDSSGWAYEEVFTGGSGESLLALKVFVRERDGRVFLVFYSEGSLYLAERDPSSGSWSTEQVEVGTVYNPSVYFDADGNPHFSFGSGSDNAIIYKRKDSSGWVREKVADLSYPPLAVPSLFISPSGEVNVFFGLLLTLNRAVRKNSGWEIETLAPAVFTRSTSYSWISPDGTVYVALMATYGNDIFLGIEAPPSPAGGGGGGGGCGGGSCSVAGASQSVLMLIVPLLLFARRLLRR